MIHHAILLFLAAIGLVIPSSTAFTTPISLTTPSKTTSALFGIALEDIEDVGYYVSVQKPLGVVFGENSEPYLGLRVDDIEMGSQGEAAGLRVGDQLLAVNANVAIGNAFDSAMGLLQSSPTKMKLLLYRGTVRDLYNILNNRGIEGDDDEDGEEVIVMDENYESPVQIEVPDRDPGFDVMKAFSKITGGGGSKDKEEEEYSPPPPKQEKKKGNGGLFGMFAEPIQLDGDDAAGTGKK